MANNNNKNNYNDGNKKRKIPSDTQYNFSLPTDQYQTLLPEERSSTLPGDSPQFIQWA